MSRDERPFEALKSVHRRAGPVQPSEDFERRVMLDVRRSAAAAREYDEERFSARLFLRLSFVSLFTALLVNASLVFEPPGEQSSLERIVQLDPFEFGGDLDE